MCATTLGRAALMAIGVFSYSQTFSQTTAAKYELGVNLGAYIYQGDLVPKRIGSLKTTRPGIGVSFAKIITPSFLVRGLFNLASLKGDEAKYKNVDPYREFRAFKFKTSVKELTVQAQWNILGASEYETKLDPYIFAGVGVAFINARRDYSNFNAAYFGETDNVQARLTEDLAVKQRRTIGVVPAGIGVRYNVNENLGINLETAYRFTGSDYIDGYSIAANPAKNDHFVSQTIGASYKLGRKDKLGCPVMKY